MGDLHSGPDPSREKADVALLAELDPVICRLLERHLASAREWHPHAFVPWSRGEDFPADYEWSPAESSIPSGVRSALFVNLLTEDNLPYYFRDIDRMFGRDGAWGTWTRRWTAEENRHSIVIRDYLCVTRAIDPVVLERGRMVQMSAGVVPEPTSAQDGLVYVALQELATRIAHHNTGKVIGDDAGYEVLKRVALDENLHFLFYRDAATAALERDPSSVVQAIERQVTSFAMPGTGIPGFGGHAARIAAAGIYDLDAHVNQILDPVVMRTWGLADIEGLSPEAEQARERTIAYIDALRTRAERQKDRRARRADRAARSSREVTDVEVLADGLD